MDAREIDAVLSRAELVLTAEPRSDLRALGFWRAVEAVKRRPELVARYADHIGELDRRAFLARARLALPIGAGVVLLLLGTGVGVALVVAAFGLPPDQAGIAVLLGAGALIGATHDLAHLVSGAASGIRFTHFYSEIFPRPQPGVKIDYASYLRAPASARAWMHASGAIVTKLVPFWIVPIAVAAGTPWWTSAVLIVIGVGQVLTDVLFSLRHGDWKKFRREMRLARS